MHEPTPPTLPERRLATELRPLHTLRPAQESDSSSEVLTWASSMECPIDNEAALQAFVELVSRLATVEPGDSFFIQDKARGGYINAEVDANGRISGWSFARDEEGGPDICTNFSIGDGQVCIFETGIRSVGFHLWKVVEKKRKLKTMHTNTMDM